MVVLYIEPRSDQTQQGKLFTFYCPPSADESVFLQVEQHMEEALKIGWAMNISWITDFIVQYQEWLGNTTTV